MTTETENPEIDNETKLRREKIYWSLRFVMVPICISLIAGEFAIAVINRQIEGRQACLLLFLQENVGLMNDENCIKYDSLYQKTDKHRISVLRGCRVRK